MKKNERLCKYCGAKLDENRKKYSDNICGKCINKYPLVRKLCAICKQIKRECGR